MFDNSSFTVLENVDISSHLTLHARVIAQYYVEVASRFGLLEAVSYAYKHSLPCFILGGGSNVSPKTPVYSGLVIKNNYVNKTIIRETTKELVLSVSSGYPMSLLVSEMIEKGWAGFEYHKGLPGTVGGAIYMNSKWSKPWSYVSDTLISANLLNRDGSESRVESKYFEFSYGYSILQKTKQILLEGEFLLKRSDPELLRKVAEKAFEYRKLTQPFGVATCGCFFKNITSQEQKKAKLPTSSSGYLIDVCGLKGEVVGDFEVSKMHANFIINKGHSHGNLSDLLELVKRVKKDVYKTFGIQLVEEVVFLA